MPTSLPVPSKGALRALRNLALGTSCTVAAGAGLLTEDRRRRIHTAQQVFENAQTLKTFKSARGYHGSVAIETFEQQLSHHADDPFWLPSSVARYRAGKTGNRRNTEVAIEKDIPPATRERMQERERVPSVRPARQSQKKAIRQPTFQDTGLVAQSTIISPHAVAPGTSAESQSKRYTARSPVASAAEGRHVLRDCTPDEKLNGQQRVALRLLQALDEGANSETENALHIFGESFRRGKPKKPAVHDDNSIPLDGGLLAKAVRLFTASENAGKEEEQLEILVALSEYSRANDITGWEAMFPDQIWVKSMAHLAGEVRTDSVPSEKGHQINEAVLKDSISLFLTCVNAASDKFLYMKKVCKIGERLCRETFLAGWYRATEELHTALIRAYDGQNSAEYLIRARFAQGKYDLCYQGFLEFFNQIEWHQQSFYMVGNCVIESLLKTNQVENAKEFLNVAFGIATKNNIQTSSAWLLKTLGHVQRRHESIDRTREMFDFLLPLVKSASHPSALYLSMMQFCVDSNLQDLAIEYHGRLIQAHPECARDIDVLGHLLWAKAKQEDWEYVSSGLHELHEEYPRRSPYQQKKLDSNFTPIMKLFVQTHDIESCEKFLQMAVEECGVQITNHLFNLMVSVYAKDARIDSLWRWMDLAISHRCDVDAVTINTLLYNMVKHQGISFSDVYKIYDCIRKSAIRSKLALVNSETRLLMEKLAISTGRTAGARRENIAKLGKLQLQKASRDAHLTVTMHSEVEMSRLYNDGHFMECVSMYKEVVQMKQKLTPELVRLAVKAQLNLDGDQCQLASALIHEAHNQGVDIGDCIAVYMVHWSKKLEAQDFDPVFTANNMQAEVQSLVSSGIKVNVQALTHTVHSLVRHGKSQLAIDFWQAMSKYFGQSPSTVDLLTLTSLLKAYVNLRNCDGIRWCLKVLIRNKLFPDAMMYRVLSEERRNIQNNPWQYLAECRECVAETSTEVRSMRQESLAEKKATMTKTLKMVEKMGHAQAARSSVARREVLDVYVRERYRGSESETLESDGEDAPVKEVSVAVG